MDSWIATGLIMVITGIVIAVGTIGLMWLIYRMFYGKN